MGLSNSDIAHRWANHDLGRNGELRSKNMRATETSLYSYSTVIAQHLDENLVVIIDESLSNSSGKHVHYVRSACSHLHVIDCHVRNSYRYDDVEIKSYWRKDDSWKERLVKVLLDCIKEKAERFKASKSLLNFEVREIDGYVDHLKWLWQNKYIVKARFKEYANEYFRLLNTTLAEEFDIETIVDVACGKGTYAKWYKRSESTRKADGSREFRNWVNAHINAKVSINSKDIQSLKKRGYFIKDGVQVKMIDFVNAWVNSGYKLETRDWNWNHKREERLYKYILGRKKDSYCSGVGSKFVKNAFTGEVYDMQKIELWWEHPTLDYSKKWDAQWAIVGPDVPLSLDEYKSSPEPKEWLRRFYKRCKIYAEKVKAFNIWAMQNGASNTTDHAIKIDPKIYDWACKRIESHRIAEEERKRLAEEEKRRIEAAKIAEYNGLIAQGVTGCRQLWYKKYASIHEAQSKCQSDDFFFGGNVLIRWKNADTVETSKGINISVTQAKIAWRTIKKWHDNPSTFKSCVMKTKSGDYTVASYENDILTAGCHDIPYCEMERMMEEINKAS